MGASTIYEKRRRQLGCECSEELYRLVRARAVATGDSMAGVLRAAIVEHLRDKPDVLSTLTDSGSTSAADVTASPAR